MSHSAFSFPVVFVRYHFPQLEFSHVRSDTWPGFQGKCCYFSEAEGNLPMSQERCKAWELHWLTKSPVDALVKPGLSLCSNTRMGNMGQEEFKTGPKPAWLQTAPSAGARSQHLGESPVSVWVGDGHRWERAGGEGRTGPTLVFLCFTEVHYMLERWTPGLGWKRGITAAGGQWHSLRPLVGPCVSAGAWGRHRGMGPSWSGWKGPWGCCTAAPPRRISGSLG